MAHVGLLSKNQRYFLKRHGALRSTTLSWSEKRRSRCGAEAEAEAEAPAAIVKVGSKKRARYQNGAELDTLSAKYLYYLSYKTERSGKGRSLFLL